MFLTGVYPTLFIFGPFPILHLGLVHFTSRPFNYSWQAMYFSTHLLLVQIRDPPPEGELFVFGSYMWGCRLERSATIEFLDSPPKQQSPTPLPLLHLALTTPSDDHTTNEASGGMAKGAESKANMTYQCPVFVNHRGRRDGERGELFRLLVHNHEVPPTRWAVRSISCTLRPF